MIATMHPKRVQVSVFKARCIDSLREVRRTGSPLVVTLRGTPIAVVGPIGQARTLGALRGECEIRGDLVMGAKGAKGDFADEWEMNG